MAHEAPTELSHDSTVDAVCDWLSTALPDGYDGKAAALAAARSLALGGRTFLSLTEAELNDRLGLARFGVRRKVYLRIKDLKETADAAEAATAATAVAAAAEDDDVVVMDSSPDGAVARAGAATAAAPLPPRGAAASTAAATNDAAAAVTGGAARELEADARRVEDQMNAEVCGRSAKLIE